MSTMSRTYVLTVEGDEGLEIDRNRIGDLVAELIEETNGQSAQSVVVERIPGGYLTIDRSFGPSDIT